MSFSNNALPPIRPDRTAAPSAADMTADEHLRDVESWADNLSRELCMERRAGVVMDDVRHYAESIHGMALCLNDILAKHYGETS